MWGDPVPSGPVGGPRVLTWWCGGVGRSVAPDFVRSVDAAATLIPPGWSWSLSIDDDLSGTLVTRAVLTPDRPGPRYVAQLPSTPASAVCLAALRARRAHPDDAVP